MQYDAGQTQETREETVVFVLGIVGLQQYTLRSGDCVPASALMAVLWLAVALQALVRAASVIGQARSQEAEDRG